MRGTNSPSGPCGASRSELPGKGVRGPAGCPRRGWERRTPLCVTAGSTRGHTGRCLGAVGASRVWLCSFAVNVELHSLRLLLQLHLGVRSIAPSSSRALNSISTTAKITASGFSALKLTKAVENPEASYLFHTIISARKIWD